MNSFIHFLSRTELTVPTAKFRGESGYLGCNALSQNCSPRCPSYSLSKLTQRNIPEHLNHLPLIAPYVRPIMLLTSKRSTSPEKASPGTFIWKSLPTGAKVSGIPHNFCTGVDVGWVCNPLRASCSSADGASNAKSSSECDAVITRAMANPRMAPRCHNLISAMSQSVGTARHFMAVDTCNQE